MNSLASPTAATVPNIVKLAYTLAGAYNLAMLMQFSPFRLPLLICIALAAASCAQPEQALSAKELYEQAKQFERSADYEEAAKKFRDVQSGHPFGAYAQQATLDLTHMYFKQDKFIEAEEEADNFVTNYPGHNRLDFAMYMRARSIMATKTDFLTKFFYSKQSSKSASALQEAYLAFSDLVTKFPASLYSDDSRLRMRFIVNILARTELDAARYYLRRGAYVASARRASDLLSLYPDSTAIEQALAILAASNRSIGANGAADDALESLYSSFPNSKLSEPAKQGAKKLASALGLTNSSSDYFIKLIE